MAPGFRFFNEWISTGTNQDFEYWFELNLWFSTIEEIFVLASDENTLLLRLLGDCWRQTFAFTACYLAVSEVGKGYYQLS